MNLRRRGRGSATLLFLVLATLVLVRRGCALTTTLDVAATGNGHEGYVSGDASQGNLNLTKSNGSNTALRIGDLESTTLPDRTIRTILSFRTSNIPANATITTATLLMTRGGGSGTIDAGFGAPYMQLKTGIYSKISPETADFAAPSTVDNAGNLIIGASDGATTLSPLNPSGVAAVNKSGGPGRGLTQMKLRYTNFTDNDGVSDFIGFYATKASTTAYHPYLRVTFSTPSAQILVLPGSLDFMSQDVDAGQTAAQTVTIQNLGALNLTINSVTITGTNASEFAITSDTGQTTLATNATRTVQVAFDPVLPGGTKTANLAISSSDAGTPLLNIPLVGDAVDQEIDATPQTLNFGTRLLGAGPSASQTANINNIGFVSVWGGGDLNIGTVKLTGADSGDFAITSDSGLNPVPAGGTRAVGVAFSPVSSLGPKTANLTITSDDTDEPTTNVLLLGTAVSITSTPTPTPTRTPSLTPTRTFTPSPTRTASGTPTPSGTISPTPTRSSTPTPTRTATSSPTRSATQTISRTATASPTRSASGTPSPTRTASVTPTVSGTITPSPTRSATQTISRTATASPTRTATGTPSPTGVGSLTATPTRTSTPTPTRTATPSPIPCAPGSFTDRANADLPVNGVVTGTYTNTLASDDAYESITEIYTGGFWQLKHKWTIPITSGTNRHVFSVEAFHGTNTSGQDDFVFAYSTDNLTFTPMLTVTKTADDNAPQTFALPSSLPSVIYIRATDTLSSDTNSASDRATSLSVDDMFIASDVLCNDATPVYHTIPSQLLVNQGFTIGIYMKNTGGTTWSQAGNYWLAITTDDCSMFSVSRMNIVSGLTVAPGETYIFSQAMQAPSVPGPCNLRFDMQQNGFPFGGPLSVVVNVIVLPNATRDWTLYE